MGERHVDELFSAAYDGALSDAERRRYEDHLGSCSRCAAAAEEFRAAIDAVRALPAARMPVRVVLPATPPVAERPSWRPGWLRLPRPGPAWGAGAMAVAGIAAVVVAVHAHGGGGGASNGSTAVFGHAALAPAMAGGGSGGEGGSGAAAGAAPNAKSAGTAGRACPGPSLLTMADQDRVAGAGQPAGFGYRVAITNPQRPGQQLVLATTGSHYAPGAEVLVVAVLTTSSSDHTAVVPCVSLQGPGGASPGAEKPQGHTGMGGGGELQQGQASGATAGSATSLSFLDAPLAVAVPTAQSVAGTLPVQVLTIPANVARGTVLQLVAEVPAGVPGGGDRPAVEAVLTLVVS